MHKTVRRQQLLPVCGLAAALVIWQILSGFTNPVFIPSPHSVLAALCGLWQTGQLQYGLIYSLARIVVASLLSMSLSIPAALLIHSVPAIYSLLMPFLSMLRFIPVTAFSPLLILWCGIGEGMKLSFLSLATFVYLLPSVLLCFAEVPQDLLDTGKTIGMRPHEIILEILLPASLPAISKTFLMMFGIGWTYVAVIEAVNAKYGLGFIVNIGAARGNTAVVFAAIGTIMLVSFVFDRLGACFIQRCFPWRCLHDPAS